MGETMSVMTGPQFVLPADRPLTVADLVEIVPAALIAAHWRR
jgi:hypothetical protein